MVNVDKAEWLSTLINSTPEYAELLASDTLKDMEPQDAYMARAEALGITLRGSYWSLDELRRKAGLNEEEYQLYCLHLVQNFELRAPGVIVYVDAYLNAVSALNEKRAAHPIHPLPTAENIRGIVDVSALITDEGGIQLPFEVVATVYTHLAKPMDFLQYLREGRGTEEAAKLLRIAYTADEAEVDDFTGVPDEWLDLLFSENPEDWEDEEEPVT